MRTHTPSGVLAATVISLALVVTACGSDGGSDSSPADEPSTTVATTTADATPGNPDTSLPSGEQVCTKVPAAVVSDELGLDVTTATPSDPTADQAPTCTYAYTNADGGAGAATVSVLRPLDMNGNAGSEGYKSFVELNKGIASSVDFTETPLDIGRQAVRFTGATTHAGIVDTGTQVVSVVVPKGDASGEQVDALLAAVTTAIG